MTYVFASFFAIRDRRRGRLPGEYVLGGGVRPDHSGILRSRSLQSSGLLTVRTIPSLFCLVYTTDITAAARAVDVDCLDHVGILAQYQAFAHGIEGDTARAVEDCRIIDHQFQSVAVTGESPAYLR